MLSSAHSLVSRLEDSRVIISSYLLAAALVAIVNVREQILVSFHENFESFFNLPFLPDEPWPGATSYQRLLCSSLWRGENY